MPGNSKARKRNQYTDLAAELRGRILHGDLAPGERLPSRLVLEKEFGASPHTIHRAINKLRGEGFLHAVARQTTSVVKYLPHQYHSAMVFTYGPADAGLRNHFYQSLCNASAPYDGSDAEPRRISVHFGVANHVDNVEMHSLVAALHAQSLAGVILPQEPYASGLAWSPLVQLPGVPRVAIRNEPIHPHVAALGFDSQAFRAKALDDLAGYGCRRIAVIASAHRPGGEESWGVAIRERGMVMHPHWFLPLPVGDPECARHVTRLLLHADQRERPEGLVVADDNLADHAQMGIVDSGIRVGKELHLVVHANFPAPGPNLLQARRLGYDARTALALCMDLLEAQRLGKPPGRSVVPAVFEEETCSCAVPQTAGGAARRETP